MAPGHRAAAVVVGAGISGLAAARVLAERFASVTLVERDRLGEGRARTGVPQARHQHLLLAGGAMALERLLPGLLDELAAAGAHLLDAGEDIGWLMAGGWAPRVRSALTVPACSRELLETTVRARVEALPGVSVLDGHDVRDLVVHDDGRTIAGVRVRARGDRSSADLVLPAELVVDAAGRGSPAPRWLAELGRTTPRETVVNARLAYASRLYHGVPELPDGLRGAIVRAAPPACQRGGIVMPIESGRCIVTLVGMGGEHPPTDPAGFDAFARSLRDPLLADAVSRAEPCPQIAASRATQNRVRHYERLADMPEGLVVLGDAACAFNPVMQQGMALGVMGALMLGRCLDRPGRHGVTRRLQRALAAMNTTPWMLATAIDLRVRGVVGAPPGARARACQRYLGHVGRRAGERGRVRRHHLEVLHFVRPARALLRPAVLGPVVAAALREGRSRATGRRHGFREPVVSRLQ
jgi:2-polyprenyl-6-methoxyphenol hydroxylase-like FAD-dependent oxidoreductase